LLTCKEFLTELTDFLDEETDVALRAKLDKHISECPNCWVVVDTCKKTMQVYKGMEPQSIPNDVESRLMNALRRKMAARRCGEA
jgi:anti-sigma factor RsiW